MLKRYGLLTILFIVLIGTMTGCGWLEDLFQSRPIPANIYAIAVEVYNICTRNNRYCDPQQAKGPPDESYVSLGGKSGYITATMSAKFTDGPGTDLRIYEVGRLQGGEDEPFDVFISSDGLIWTQVADNAKNDSGKVYASIDITPNTGKYQYVKIVDESTITYTSIGTPGSDIDAIEALWAAAGSFTISNNFIWPVLGESVSDPLQNTRDPSQDDWYVANGFGDSCPECSGDSTHPYHTGEDWNRTDGNDADLPVYAIADGEVIRSAKLSDALGWSVIIRHRLSQELDLTPYVLSGTLPPRPGTSVISSAYFHLNQPRFSELDIRKGDQPVPIRQGEVVDIISPNMSGGPHLHFEIRANDAARTADPTTNVNGYYASWQAIADFGYIDPSKFLQDQISP